MSVTIKVVQHVIESNLTHLDKQALWKLLENMSWEYSKDERVKVHATARLAVGEVKALQSLLDRIFHKMI